MNVSVSPTATVAAPGTFGVSWVGLIQGTAFPDPETRFALVGGNLDSTETLPMWGGIGIYENIPGVAGNSSVTLGPKVGRATALTGSKALAGFSVFDQAYGMVNSPNSPVPTIGGLGQVMYYRLGSGARIALPCDADLASLAGSPTDTDVSWDFTNEKLVPYSAPTFSSATYNSGTGAVTVTTTAAHGLLPGDTIIVSGAAATGSDTPKLNGTFILATGTTGSTLVYDIATGLTISAITGMTLSTGGILPVKLLDIQSTGCMTVLFDGTNATWNYNGSAAVVLI